MKTMNVMKTMTKDIRTLAALLIASATFVACSNDENIIEEQPVNPAQQVYTMTIQASKLSGDDATTRGLYWNNPSTYDEIKVYWHEGEEVRVVQNGSVVGTLTSTASEDGSTTLSGTLTGVIQDADLQFFLHADENCKMDYTGQKGGVVKQGDNDGNIEYNYDFAEATLTKTSFRLNTETGTITNMDNSVLNFTSNQAIVRFELFNSDGSANVYAKKLIISDANTGKIVKSIDGLTGEKTYGPLTYSPYAFSQSCIFTVALNVGSDATIVLDAIDSEGNVFAYNRSQVTFTPGKYYKVKVKMQERTQKFITEITPEDTYIKGWYVTEYGTVVKDYDESSCYAVVAYVGKVDHYFNNFIALGLKDSKKDGTGGTPEYGGVDSQFAMNWSDALKAVYNYDEKHHVYQISSTSMNSAYDVVANDEKTSSATATGNAQTGWRLPSVTDWRYIFEGLGNISATEPAGIYAAYVYFEEGDQRLKLLTTLNDNYHANLLENFYWTSSEHDTKNAWYFKFGKVIIDIIGSGEGTQIWRTQGFWYDDEIGFKECNYSYVRPVFAY